MIAEDIRDYDGKQESLDQLSIVIIDFETDYREENGRLVLVDGRPVPRDKVILGKIGDAQYRQHYWISRLLGERSDDPRIAAFVRPHYENWKKGEALSFDGTPLAALAFIPKRAVQAYRAANIHTAEALANLEDAALPKLGLDARNHRDMAKLYVANANGDTAKTAAALKAQDDEIKALKERLAEMEANARPRKAAA